MLRLGGQAQKGRDEEDSRTEAKLERVFHGRPRDLLLYQTPSQRGRLHAGTQLPSRRAGRQKAIHDCPHLLEFGILRRSTESSVAPMRAMQHDGVNIRWLMQ